jgi:IS4 transposase
LELIELFYALHTRGAINGEAASINEIALLFQRIFTIELHFRKINHLKCLDRLKAPLHQRIKNAEI